MASADHFENPDVLLFVLYYFCCVEDKMSVLYMKTNGVKKWSLTPSSFSGVFFSHWFTVFVHSHFIKHVFLTVTYDNVHNTARNCAPVWEVVSSWSFFLGFLFCRNDKAVGAIYAKLYGPIFAKLGFVVSPTCRWRCNKAQKHSNKYYQSSFFLSFDAAYESLSCCLKVLFNI